MSNQPSLWKPDGNEDSRASGDPALFVDVNGFEGPLDLLLTLARHQKVDLTKISILALAEQYLRFIEQVRKLRLEIAADYLVMAAWLAYLKSRLMLPDPEDEDELSGEDMAAHLAFRLKRLEAMRKAADMLMDRPRLGVEIFPRGAPEQVSTFVRHKYSVSLYELLTAYASQRQRQSISTVHVKKRTVWSLQESREILQRLIGNVRTDWRKIDDYLIKYLAHSENRTTVIASTFAASLEMVREGLIEIKQSAPFSPIYTRLRQSAPGETDVNTASTTISKVSSHV
ncbi:MAG: segregation/condensation protein A [Hyphomicrobiales bacterium]|nr:MAG: segregation/condensation protein A [Hyphomicrobiales bacterium]